MLQRLGRRLTLLNLAISGAILITMACLALGIAESTIVEQYEDDLTTYARSMSVTMFRLTSTDSTVILQTHNRYMVYQEDWAGNVHIAASDPDKENEALAVAQHVKPILSGELTAGDTVFSMAFSADAIGGDSAATPPQGAAIRAWSLPMFAGTQHAADELVSSHSAAPATVHVNGNAYRVYATQVSRDDTSTLTIVMQDRAEELQARHQMRWLFGGCVALGLGLILLASIFLSGRAIQPIDHSIRQQRAFVAAASHELRTPVAALHANAEILADAPLGEYAPYLDAVLHVSERITLLVSDLMNLARGDAGELAVQLMPVDAHEVAAKAALWMRPLAEQRSIRLSEDLRTVVMAGDPDRLRQTLLALLDNAVRYTPEHGEITVSVRREGRQACIRVEDTGIGIPDAHKPYVFDRFYRLDAARSRHNGGFGLGLSIVKQLVEQMEGTIALSDRPGGGSRFEMRFKLAES